MTHPAFDVLVEAARHLDARDGTITAAADSTHVTDAYWGLRTQDANAYKQGTYFQKYNGVTPWNAVSVVSASLAGTYTLMTALPGTPTVGGSYVVLGNSYPFSQLCQKLMAVVQEYGDVTSEDTSLTTAANTLEYTIPASSTSVSRCKRVDVETYAGSGVYDQALGVRIDERLGKIVFPYQPLVGCKIRLTLMTSYRLEIGLGELPDLPDTIAPEWAALEVAGRVARWRLMQSGDDSNKETMRVNDLLERAKAARAKYALPRLVVQPRLAFTEVR